MMADPEPRAIQEQFAAYAREHVETLRKVLRDGSDGDQRAVAATVIGYAPKKAEVSTICNTPCRTRTTAVRANAIRSLVAIAVLASKQPELGIRDLAYLVRRDAELDRAGRPHGIHQSAADAHRPRRSRSAPAGPRARASRAGRNGALEDARAMHCRPSSCLAVRPLSPTRRFRRSGATATAIH